MRTLELLSPAKDLECGIAAIDNGADAIYIGAEKFSARAAAGNSLTDIERLVRYAHQYGSKVYVTVNTIIYDEELENVRQLIKDLHDIGVDALIVQDLAILDMAKDTPCPPLHASTQMDIRTVEKVRWLYGLGFKRVVLARELTLEEIAEIHEAVPEMELEVFVHGALCVSYSGQCYASQYCFNRSANRGNCAQFCRLKFNLEDGNGNTLLANKYLLSLKDMNRLDRLSDLAKAGVASFKIEGRLKDANYVKNVTAAYSQQLTSLISRCPNDYKRASHGMSEYDFIPDLNKTFNRGFTSYFLDGRGEQIADFDTPKAKGEYVGNVKSISERYFIVSGIASFSNGDGLCFVNTHGILEGFRVNRVEGNKLFPHSMPEGLFVGAQLFRNNDENFQKNLASSQTKRKIAVAMRFAETDNGFMLTMTDETGREASDTIELKKDMARLPQCDNIKRQLLKLGNTVFCADDVEIQMSAEWFVPSAMLSDLRRRVCEQMLEMPLSTEKDETSVKTSEIQPFVHPKQKTYDYLANVSNALSAKYYVAPCSSFEVRQPHDKKLIMQCRHCILWSLGQCRKQKFSADTKRFDADDLYLALPDKRRFKLEFDCNNCRMNVFVE